MSGRDGGPAFPCVAHEPAMAVVLRKAREGGEGLSMQDITRMAKIAYPGMSLRDYFAIHIDMQGLSLEPEEAAALLGIEPPEAHTTAALLDLSAKVVARLRYLYADAMLAAREDA